VKGVVHALVHVAVVAGAAVGALCLLNVAKFVAAHFCQPKDAGGDQAQGLVLWAEPLRFANIRWGERSVTAGLRRAGWGGQFLYWKWHRWWEGTLLLPALCNRRAIERQARRLARFIAEVRAASPARFIYLMGYSAGGFVAARALELLQDGVQVDGAALLASTFSPWRDLSSAARHVRGRLLVSASVTDFWVCGLGTLLFGNADGTHLPAVGMLGYLGPPDPKVVQRHWRVGMILEGLLGMHDWSMMPGFIWRYVAVALGMCGAGRMPVPGAGG
jgi:pimeloyl-ACP methyl ester carboxylesterase